MAENKKVEFPSETFAAAMEQHGIRINTPLFQKYNLPDGMDEQSLNDLVKFRYETTDNSEIARLSQLAVQIKSLNPELNAVELAPDSAFDAAHFLHGVASRFTVRDIKCYLLLRSTKKYKIVQAKREFLEEEIREYIGIIPNFFIEPKVYNEIIAAIRKKKLQEKRQQNFNTYENWRQIRGMMDD